MKTITVCVGSSCHMKGSHRVIDRLGELIEENNLQNDVELKASFCMEQCTGNIGAVIDDKVITDLTRDNVDEVFRREIIES
ncbi:MAG: (2Fe-2S) ferredoxin domain-containing protein [Firmicutes bacterium]|nr:(2Fe-2S) ferredoxin domain-containing protein [Bacillota bacterium]